ncbi:hypothetical protein [Granulicella aggregans]|jgi:hypothetical protein|uniref:hypothetical protein n=1 Tax=Granulicella aggregans TaxID=474949 RepID=UPI0021DF87ED|nr:hypothetical protein [Granulicella aggregans]
MFASITSAENTPQRWRSRANPPRFRTTINLLMTVIVSLGLFRRTINNPNNVLIISSAILVLLEIPMISYTVFRMSSNVKLRESWIGRQTVPPWIDKITLLLIALSFICFLGDWVGLPGKQWNLWSDAAFPFFWLFIAFGDTNFTRESPDEQDLAETQRRWAFAYKLGWRTGSFFSIPARNIPSI